MDILPAIIKILSKEEIRAYKLFTKRTNDVSSRKDIELFDSIKKDPEKNHDERAMSIYHERTLDPKYYRLKNKIADDLGLTLIHLNHKKQSVDVLYHIALAKIYVEKKQFKLAFHYLTIAEKKAILQEAYSLLDVIYEFMISYHEAHLRTNPETIIEKRTENFQRMALLQNLENNFSKLSYQLKQTQNFIIDEELNAWLKQTIKTTRDLPYVKNSRSLRIKTFQNLIRLLVLVKDYKTLKKYLEDSFNEFETDHFFNKDNHSIKLELIVYLCNTHYILHKFKEAIKYTDLLYEEMQKYNQQFIDTYLFFYYNIQVNIYSQLDIHKAIGLLDKSEKEPLIKANHDHYFYVLINLAGLNFNIHHYKLAAKAISKIYIHTNFKTMDIILKLKVMVFEIVIRLELKELDLCRKQLHQAIHLSETISEKQKIKDETEVLGIITACLVKEKIQWKLAAKQIVHFLKGIADSPGYLDYRIWVKDKLKQ